MALKAEVSLPIALATGAVVYGIFQMQLPPTAVVKATMPNNQHLESSRRTATVVSLAVAGGISLMAKDPSIFVVGGTIAVVMDFIHRHADAVQPQTGQLVAPATGTPTVGTSANGNAVTASADQVGAGY
jgi:hypothetical protein